MTGAKNVRNQKGEYDLEVEEVQGVHFSSYHGQGVLNGRTHIDSRTKEVDRGNNSGGNPIDRFEQFCQCQ